MIQLIAGLLAPTRGRVLQDGVDINGRGFDKNELYGKIGLVFQFPGYQLFETTVEKDVAFGLKHSGLGRDETAERVRWALETVGFSYDAIRTQSPLALSGGEKRRVAIAGILASKPKVLIFDEPTAGLDPAGQEAFIRLVAALNLAGTTVIMVSHNADSLGEAAKRILVLENGRLVMDGATQEVFSDVERMEGLGLGVSAPRRIAALLKRRGMDIPQDIVDFDGLLSALRTQGKGAEPK
jgi:energy-coupling factor transport system ATP-binding protein